MMVVDAIKEGDSTAYLEYAFICRSLDALLEDSRWRYLLYYSCNVTLLRNLAEVSAESNLNLHK